VRSRRCSRASSGSARNWFLRSKAVLERSVKNLQKNCMGRKLSVSAVISGTVILGRPGLAHSLLRGVAGGRVLFLSPAAESFLSPAAESFSVGFSGWRLSPFSSCLFCLFLSPAAESFSIGFSGWRLSPLVWKPEPWAPLSLFPFPVL